MKKFRVFLQNFVVPAIFRIYGIIFLKKIIEYVHSTVDRVHQRAPAHGSTDFIKRRSLATGSTAQIKPIELASRLLISVVHHQSNG
jgi:hypothetical protein